MAVTLSDKSIIMDKKKRITLAQEELELLYSILLNGSSLLENKSDEEKKYYRSLFEKTKKAYISKEL